MSNFQANGLYEHDLAVQVDHYFPEEIRTGIEANYYAHTNAQATFDHFAHDPGFLENPATHLALYSDHGIVHSRDVARQVLRVLDTANGLLIPRRQAGRWEFLRGYGVILACVHDIGMLNNTPFGREMHAEFATQEVFSDRFDAWIDTLWKENSGNLAWRLIDLSQQGALEQEPKRVLREMLAMANVHSKTKVPIAILNDRQALRRTMQFALGMDLHALHFLQQVERVRTKTLPPPGVEMEQETIEGLAGSLLTAEARLKQGTGCPDLSNSPNRTAQAHYHDFEAESFAWLVSDQEEVCALVSDVVDTLRALRCADALRQRGTVLRTSGGYPIVLNRLTANAVYVFRRNGGETFLVEAENIVSGEANLASCEITREGDLRISFVRGAFPNKQVERRAARHAALAIYDIQRDAIESFQRPSHETLSLPPSLKSAPEMGILLEGVEDNPAFAEMVRKAMQKIDSVTARRISIVASLHSVSDRERAHYLNAGAVQCDLNERKAFLEQLAERGYRTERIDPEQAFTQVRIVPLTEGEILIAAGEPSGFVYVPMGEGLTSNPLGGYQPHPVPAWAPLGASGVIRGAPRSATVVSHAEVRVLIIPREVFLRFWFHPYALPTFADRLSQTP